MEEQKSAQKSTHKRGGKGMLKGLISGTFITEKLILNNLRYAVLIVVLGIIFIANRFGAERMEREITILEQEVRDLRAESLSVSAELGGVSRQSEIIDLVKERGLGLEELREPPYRIVVNE
jgi:cell division protein FtsL